MRQYALQEWAFETLSRETHVEELFKNLEKRDIQYELSSGESRKYTPHARVRFALLGWLNSNQQKPELSPVKVELVLLPTQ